MPGISVQSLGSVAAEAVGTIGPRQGGFGAALWAGANRAMVERLIPELPARSPSPTIRDLTRRLLLTAAIPPSGEGSRDFVALRAERLLAMGDVDSAALLIDNAPARERGERLQTIAVQADLLRYDLTSACSEIDRNPAIFTEFWQKTTVFCNVLAGNESQATLGLDLLREQSATDDVLFFSLVDLLLSGAEPAGFSDGDATPLNLALLRAARAQIPEGFIANAEPGVLRAIALSPNAADDVRLRAGLVAGRTGALAPGPVGELLRTHLQQGSDNELATITQLVLGAAEETVPTARAAALQRGLSAADEAGLYGVFAALSAGSLQDLSPSTDIAWFGHDAARALLLNAAPEAALEWYEILRSEGRFDPELAVAAQELWPLLRLAFAAPQSPMIVSPDSSNAESDEAEAAQSGITVGSAAGERVSAASVVAPGRTAVVEQLVAPAVASPSAERFPFDARQLSVWIETVGAEAMAVPPTLTMLAALGDPINTDVWAGVAGQDAGTDVAAIDPTLWLALQQAAADRRLGETILLAAVLVGETDLSRANRLALHSAVSALRAVGLTEEARRLAVEAAIAGGA